MAERPLAEVIQELWVRGLLELEKKKREAKTVVDEKERERTQEIN